jgi:hypothetical protein
VEKGEGKEELYISAGLEVNSASGGMTWLTDGKTGRTELLEDAYSGLLPHLGAWRSLDGHAAAVAELGVGAGGSSMIHSAIRELVDRGLLLSRTEFIRALAGQAAVRPRVSIASISWCTRDRPEELARSVTSYRTALVDAGRAPAFIVFDDSTDPGVRKLNRDSLRRISPEIRYTGLEEKQRLAHEIVAQGDGIDPETMSFALFGLPRSGVTVGANHNAMLLATSGEMTFSCDDDTLCEFTRLDESTFEPELSSAMDPTEYRFFNSWKELSASVRFEQQDILARHAEILGGSAKELVARNVALERCSPGFTHRLMKNGGTVVATASGICGDCGLADSRYVLATQGHSRERLMSSEALYRAASSNRLLLRVAPRMTVSDGTYFQAMCVALDNRLPLPPFFPVGRNFDGVFGQTVRACFPDWYIGHLPWAVHHQPAIERHFQPEDLVTLPIRITEIVNLLLATFESGLAQFPPMDRMDAAGRFFQDVAALPERDFLEYVRSHYLFHLSRYVEYLEAQLAIHGQKPEFWVDDVEAHLERVRALPAGSDFCIPTDLREGRSNDEALTLTRQMVDQFGVLMESWPEILAAAGSVRESEGS